MRRGRCWETSWGSSWRTSGSHRVLENESLGEGIKEGIWTRSHHLGPLVSLPPSQEGAIVKHVLGQGVQGPEVPLAWVARLPRDLDEAVIETQIMSDAVLPGGESVLVVGESVPDELTDAVQCESLVGALDNAHGDQGDVGVGRLHTSAALHLDLGLRGIVSVNLLLLSLYSVLSITLIILGLVK